MEDSLSPQRRRELARLALQAREERSRPVISGYAVGAALLARDGRVFLAGNIECYGQTPSICAERVALFKAVSEGCEQFAAIAVCGGPAGAPPPGYCPPCGVCRQVLLQFGGPDMPVLVAKSEDEIRDYTVAGLLPDFWAGPGC